MHQIPFSTTLGLTWVRCILLICITYLMVGEDCHYLIRTTIETFQPQEQSKKNAVYLTCIHAFFNLRERSTIANAGNTFTPFNAVSLVDHARFSSSFLILHFCRAKQPLHVKLLGSGHLLVPPEALRTRNWIHHRVGPSLSQ